MSQRLDLRSSDKHVALQNLCIYYTWKKNNRQVFKIEDGYKLVLQTPETMKLFSNTKKVNRQNKKRRKHTKSWSYRSSFSPM